MGSNPTLSAIFRWGARAVESGSLENCYTSNGIVGSNPTPTAHQIMEKGKRKYNLQEYQKFCKKTAKKFSNKEKEIFTWGLGIAGEAGDVAGCIKKTFSHKNDQKDGIRENLGDVLWYAGMICNFFNWDFQEILEENVKKLKKRYPDGFKSEKARRKGNRIDWNEK